MKNEGKLKFLLINLEFLGLTINSPKAQLVGIVCYGKKLGKGNWNDGYSTYIKMEEEWICYSDK